MNVATFPSFAPVLGGDPFDVWSIDDMENLEPPKWVVEGALPLGGRTLLFAPSGHHKTNLAVDMACHVAHGLTWHGLEVTKCPVIVVATEDPHGTSARILGCHKRYGLPAGRVIVVPGGEFRLNDPASITRLKATAEKHFPGEAVGYVIDHYDVSMERDPTATVEAVQAAAGLRELGQGSAFVLLLAHTTWTTDNRAKMPVALWANVDARLKCERDEVTGRATLTVQHQKNGRSGDVLQFEFEEYAFETKKGPVTVLIASRLYDASVPPKSKLGKDLGDNEKLVLDYLRATLCDHARDIPPARDIPFGTRGVKLEQWEEATLRYLPQTDTARKREAFKRASKSLVRRHRVLHVGGWVWLPKADIA